MHSDHPSAALWAGLGSTSLVTAGTTNGGVVARQLYSPYGQARPGGAGTLPTDFTFTGQRMDSTGLMYYRARYYDPALGRFISADTIVPEPGNPQAFNRYAYTLGNPLKYTDPTGHCIFGLDTAFCVAAAGALVVAFLVGCTPQAETNVWAAPQSATAKGAVNMPVSTTWNPYATMPTDEARAATYLTPEVGAPPGSGIGGWRGQTHDLAGDQSRISLATAMLMIHAAFAPGSEIPLVASQVSDIEYVKGMLRGTGLSAQGKMLDPEGIAALKSATRGPRIPSLLHLVANYDSQGRALEYSTSSAGRSGYVFGVWVILRGITSDDLYIIFDNPVDAEGELYLPVSLWQGLPYFFIGLPPGMSTPAP